MTEPAAPPVKKLATMAMMAIHVGRFSHSDNNVSFMGSNFGHYGRISQNLIPKV
jgi:hypothetical protein